jgi:hypothetical protein
MAALRTATVILLLRSLQIGLQARLGQVFVTGLMVMRRSAGNIASRTTIGGVRRAETDETENYIYAIAL